MFRNSHSLISLVVLLGLSFASIASAADPSLVLKLPFDEGEGEPQDLSMYGHAVERINNPVWVEGQSGSALEFDGSNYVQVPVTDALQLVETFTAEFWVSRGDTQPGTWNYMVAGGTLMWAVIFNASDGSIYVWSRSGGNWGQRLRSTQPLSTDWTHIAVTYDTNGGIALYLNGEKADEDATPPVVDEIDGAIMVAARNPGQEFFTGVIDSVLLYNRILSAEDIARDMLDTSELSSNPLPESEATDVQRDAVLSWEPGEFAVTHDVYLGTVFGDVNDASRDNPMDVLLSQSQTAMIYDPEGVFEFGQTYYWRVDEVNGAPDNTIFKGEVWSFTVEPFAYAIENVTASTNGTSEAGAGPENTVNGSGLNENDEHSVGSGDMWQAVPGAEPLQIQYEFPSVLKLHEMLVWNYNVQFELMLGFGVKDVTVEYSEDGETWVALGDVTLNQGTAMATYTANTTIAFDGVAAQAVRLTVNSGYGMLGQFGLSEVRFLSIPVLARQPQPEDGAADVSVAAELDWRAGREAISHEVYLSTDPETLDLIDTTAATTVDPGALDLAATYYWQVTEVNEAEAISTWEGAIWSFSTEAYIVVEDFEAYDDEDNVIYDSWIDGWVNETGSTVGYLSAPFAEQDIVNSGSQSMPLSYDNAGVATSEADFNLGQNWTGNGIQSLSLYFHGDAANSGGQLYLKINGTKIAYDGSAVNLTRATWNLWSIDLAASGASLSNVSSLTIGIEGAGATGVVYIDDIRLYPEVLAYHKSPDVTAAGDAVQGVPNDGDWPDAETPDLAVDDDVNTKFLHRQGGAMATGIQVTPAAGVTVVTGLTLTTANDAPARDPITFELSGSNAGIDGPYELIAAGDVVDFAGAAEWPRFTKNATLITFDNDAAYTHYQIVFPTLRGESESLMQIAEVELIGETP